MLNFELRNMLSCSLFPIELRNITFSSLVFFLATFLKQTIDPTSSGIWSFNLFLNKWGFFFSHKTLNNYDVNCAPRALRSGKEIRGSIHILILNILECDAWPNCSKYSPPFTDFRAIEIETIFNIHLQTKIHNNQQQKQHSLWTQYNTSWFLTPILLHVCLVNSLV